MPRRNDEKTKQRTAKIYGTSGTTPEERGRTSISWNSGKGGWGRGAKGKRGPRGKRGKRAPLINQK
jgi:hypothetical protein